MKNKNFLIDTNILIHNPESIFDFSPGNLYITITVIEELDKLKRLGGIKGRSSRIAIRYIDTLIHEISHQDIEKGIPMENDGLLFIISDEHFHSSDRNDTKIIKTAAHLNKTLGNLVFVSKDLAARIKASTYGLETQDYVKQSMHSDFSAAYIQNIECSHEIFESGYLPEQPLVHNQYAIIHDKELNANLITRYDHSTKQLKKIKEQPKKTPKKIWGLTPLNTGQYCALDALLDNNIHLISLLGGAGTGKTLLALAAALHHCRKIQRYKKILVSRPIVPLGRDIGYLPGTKEEKLHSWMQPIFDNLEFLCNNEGIQVNQIQDWLIKSGTIELEAVTYIRGRSIPNMFIIIDEAQNLTEHEVKTIISRAGNDSKVVFTGDLTQIDNPYLDKRSSGLLSISRAFEGQDIFSQIYLEKSERSKLAKLAVELM